jgi:hypothetical protein
MYIKWKIERTPFVGGAYKPEDTEVITGYHGLMVRVSLGSTKKDSFQFNLLNINDKYSGYFNNLDKVIIYRARNTDTFTDDDILINGVIAKVNETRTANSAILQITGYNYTEATLSALTVSDPKSLNLTIPQAIKVGIESIAGDNPNTFPIVWKSTNPVLKRDGVTAFPVVPEYWFNVPLIDKIEKYSRNTATQDGTYMYYINKDNEFVWIPKLNTISFSFDATTDFYLSLKPNSDNGQVVNYVIMKGGVDPKGSAMDAIYVDETSKAKNGIKYYIDDSDNSYAQTLNQEDIFFLGGNPSQHGTLPSNIGSVYPFTPRWSTTSVANDSE